MRDPDPLDDALRDIGDLMALPHCKTPLGRTFAFEDAEEALGAVGAGEGKPVLIPPAEG